MCENASTWKSWRRGGEWMAKADAVLLLLLMMMMMTTTTTE
jgi:hypothetical protein